MTASGTSESVKPERRAEVRSDGVRFSVREWPGPEEKGRSALLLHGLASTSHIFDLIAPILARRLRVVTYDQRGHGESGKPSAGYGFAQVAADALSVIRTLRLKRPVVVGHSWGANVALEVADRTPRLVAGAVLLDGGFVRMRDYMDWATARLQFAPPPLAGMPVDQFLSISRGLLAGKVEVTPRIEAAILSLIHVDGEGRIRPRLSRANHMRILRALWAHDPPAHLRRARVPILVLATREPNPGEGERFFHEAKLRAASAVRAIGGPVVFEWIEGIHDIPIQRPKAVAARIERFAREALGGGA
jgi:pimeloyl-ACP methyl ester carboxylesterase